MPLPVDTTHSDETADHGDPDNPPVILHETGDLGHRHAHSYCRAGQYLNTENRVYFANESQSDRSVAINNCYADLEVIGQVILSWLIHPCVP
jgi:hypothetical protein